MVKAVLGVRGEPGQPANPATGLVWSSIVENIASDEYDDTFISITRVPRRVLATHPWSLTGGGASALQGQLELNTVPMRNRIESIGRTTVVGEDDAWFTSCSRSRALGLIEAIRPLIIGENVRDFRITNHVYVWWPYDDVFQPSWVGEQHPLPHQILWPNRTLLGRRVIFGQSLDERNRPWYDHLECYVSKLRTPLSIAFAFVATHNHFVLDRGGKIFNRSAPVIKLPKEASEDDHLALLGVLNSSTACFWLKQNSHNKASAFTPSGMMDQPWSWNYEFTGTTLQDFPLPSVLPLERARSLDRLAHLLVESSPSAVVAEAVPTAAGLTDALRRVSSLRGRMIAEQEELDWDVYWLYGILDEDLTYPEGDLPELALGERAFETALARRVAAGEEETAWFTRHGSTPITQIPSHWPAAYRALVQRRLDLIESDRFIGLLEKPEHKRRWASEPWDKQVERALRGWLLDRLEDRAFWFDPQGRPAPRSVAQLADHVSRDADLVSVLELWSGRKDQSDTTTLAALLADEGAPFLAAYRLKDTGLRKREAWEHTWDLQRREDAGEQVGRIPVPPKYTSADFKKAGWWQHRGKLDVPKERFILYSDAGRETDSTALLGWAGWDHAQQALALGAIIGERENEGWPDERLVPLVAGLAELQPWVTQWHNEIDPAYGVNLAEFCAEHLRERAGKLGLTVEEIRAWRPAAPTRGRRSRA